MGKLLGPESKSQTSNAPPWSICGRPHRSRSNNRLLALVLASGLQSWFCNTNLPERLGMASNSDSARDGLRELLEEYLSGYRRLHATSRRRERDQLRKFFWMLDVIYKQAAQPPRQ